MAARCRLVRFAPGTGHDLAWTDLVPEAVPFRWRREFGGLKTDQVKRLKELEAENAQLRRAVSDLTLDKMILAEAARGNF